ncbi:prepilin-type N-terminal cleavage/methylation domain-containing protein [Candidatus Daviesbacteria bacterium]|nr:prepilin-type N-terminal cleavage/methylation domain-containing protein [Candidatus Daviesbacteria bacterium]
MNLEKIKHCGGFTLIETIVTVILISIIGTIISGVTLRVLNSTKKSETISALRQNGQSALSQITEQLRKADAMVCSDFKVVTLKDEKGVFIRYFFAEPTETQNGTIKRDYPETNDQAVTPFDTDKFCNLVESLPSDPIELSKSDNLQGVSIENGKFIMIDKKTLSIFFEVRPSKGTNAKRIGDSAPESAIFKTTVQIK